MHTFVNPLPGYKMSKWLGFDFPLEYRTPKCLPNVDLLTEYAEAPAVEEIYGMLGDPPKAQGHPCMREIVAEAEDPNVAPYHDQIIDQDRDSCIDHTARLSGSFVKYLELLKATSVVKMHAHPLTNGTKQILLWDSKNVPVVAQTAAPNVWYWGGVAPDTRHELLFTAQAIVKPDLLKKMETGIYKLVVNWEFWSDAFGPKDRLPISGFSDALTFELSPTAVAF